MSGYTQMLNKVGGKSCEEGTLGSLETWNFTVDVALGAMV